MRYIYSGPEALLPRLTSLVRRRDLNVNVVRRVQYGRIEIEVDADDLAGRYGPFEVLPGEPDAE